MNTKIKQGFLGGFAAKNQHKKILQLAFCLFGLSQITWAQTDYSISASISNDIKLSGTSSLHDWDMHSYVFAGNGQFVFKKDDKQTLVGLNSLTFSLPVKSLKSNKKGLNKNAYKALKKDTYKNIMYSLLSAKVSPENDRKFLIKTKGDLTISGMTREVAMDVYCVVNENSTINCSGTEALKMSDYKVKPPSFMWGAMKTGDAITIDFTMVYTNNNPAEL